LIAAGGTGGHVIPALAVAEQLREAGHKVVWVGTRKGIESRLVPQAGFDIEWLSVTGLRGKGASTLLLAPFRLLHACWQAGAVVLRHQPKVLMGMGGFVTGPAGLMAKLLGKKLVIHEQNAIAGTTNKLLSRLADRVLTGMPSAFATGVDSEYVGNPVSASFISSDGKDSEENSTGATRNILIVGGSQGAKIFNEIVPDCMPEFANVQVWHQTGKSGLESTEAAYKKAGVQAKVTPFIDDMASAYAWSDLVISRAGAMTVAELAASGSASVLVPYPHAIDDHQTANSQALVDGGAAVLLPQTEFTKTKLKSLLNELLQDSPRLHKMAEAARRFSKPNATQLVAQIVMEKAR